MTEKRTNTYGGRIYISDFDTSRTFGNTVSRIVEDMRFDEQCKKNCEERDKKGENKNV